MDEFVPIKHAGIEGEASVPERTLPSYARRGWVRADEAPQPSSTPVDTPADGVPTDGGSAGAADTAAPQSDAPTVVVDQPTIVVPDATEES